ncbi:MAG: 4-alpha-glucanotransferase, partial [Planctomycetota bacterium]
MGHEERRELRALKRLARFCGVHTAYMDQRGRLKTASPEVLIAVLRSLGQPIETTADAEDALGARSRELSRRFAEPVAVAWEGEAAFHTLRLPPDA